MEVSVLLIRALVDALEQAGVSRDAFFEASKLDPHAIDRPDGRIGLVEYDALSEVALDLSGDPALGLHLGETTTATTHSVVAHLIANSTTLRDGIDALLRFYRLFTDRPAWRLVESGAEATLHYDVAPGPVRGRRFRAETTMTGFYRMVRAFARKAIPHAVAFEHAAPDYRTEYTRIFQGTERFEQPFTGVVFDRALLSATQRIHDEDFHAVMESQAEKRLARLTRGVAYANRVRDYLLDAAAPDRRDMESAARFLGLSVRSLRRRLHREGSSFSDVADEALALRAKRLLDDRDRTIEQAAYEMGFSAPSAFHKAFKRWTGTTPREYRLRQR